MTEERWCPFTKTKCTEKCAVYGVAKCGIVEALESDALSTQALTAVVLNEPKVARDLMERLKAL